MTISEIMVLQADPSAVNVKALRRELELQLQGEVRFDKISRTLYSTDASVYQIEPLGVVIPKSAKELELTVQTCARHRCPITLRGGGTSQSGQAIGAGLQIDTSKYLNQVLEINADEQWARVEPGVILDELNARLRPYGLMFAPDVSTSNRATIGGMMANNSSGARSVIYGKTIDHVLETKVLLSDGVPRNLYSRSTDDLKQLCRGNSLEAHCYRTVCELAADLAPEIDRRYPKILRRVGGYNLDCFVRPNEPFNLSKLLVGSEGTLGVILEAKLRLVPLPKAKALTVVHFEELMDALAVTPSILEHGPAAVEVLDRFVLEQTRHNPALERLRGFIQGDPGAILIVEFYGDEPDEAISKIERLEHRLRAGRFGYHYHRAIDPTAQAQIWSLRKAALGLSMAMRGDAKAISFVEDTAVAPEKLSEYIGRFSKIIERHGTRAGVYAHASVGCLHVRPVINLKTEEGVRQFESIAHEVADLVLEYGGAISGEHGDGLVRSPFNCKMFGPELYEAFRTIKRTFDPDGIFNPGKIVDSPPVTANLRFGPRYQTPDPPTFFDYSEYGGFGRAVEMCAGVGACRKKLEGTMCPSYMVTLEETHSTRGRANALRQAMSGALNDAGLGDREIYEVLDLCLECRACKAECPTGVDMARFKSEFLAEYWKKNPLPLRARVFGNLDVLSEWACRFASAANWFVRSQPGRWLNERYLGIDRRRTLPRWQKRTFRQWFAARNGQSPRDSSFSVLLFSDTFTNYFEPEVAVAAVELLESSGARVQLRPHRCCGRPLISQGLLEKARDYARANTALLFSWAAEGGRILFCEPSCLSAMREDAPALLRGEEQKKAEVVANACELFEGFLERQCKAGKIAFKPRAGPGQILLHGHCHQKAMGLVPESRALLSRIPECKVVELDAGCCGMAGSFGYLREHYEISQKIAERRLLPAIRNKAPGTMVVASGTSCRHQIEHFTGEKAIHPAVLLQRLWI